MKAIGMVRATRGAAAQEAIAAQHGSSVVRSGVLPFECDDDGAQPACSGEVAAALPWGAMHAAAVPTMMKCIIASSVSIPSERRMVMISKIAPIAAAGSRRLRRCGLVVRRCDLASRVGEGCAQGVAELLDGLATDIEQPAAGQVVELRAPQDDEIHRAFPW